MIGYESVHTEQRTTEQSMLDIAGIQHRASLKELVSARVK